MSIFDDNDPVGASVPQEEMAASLDLIADQCRQGKVVGIAVAVHYVTGFRANIHGASDVARLQDLKLNIEELLGKIKANLREAAGDDSLMVPGADA